MAQRRYWMQEQTGNIGNLQLKNDTIERPASGEARIAVKAVSAVTFRRVRLHRPPSCLQRVYYTNSNNDSLYPRLG